MFENANNIVITGSTFTSIQTVDAGVEEKLARHMRPPGFYNWGIEHCNTRTSGTCEWSTCHLMINNWLRSDTSEPSRLWIHGGPGTGKSVLAAYLADRAKEQRSPREVVFTTFCTTQGDVRPTSGSIVLDFLRQYVVDYTQNHDRGIIKGLSKTILSEEKGHPFHVKGLERHLMSILALFDKARFIIDGVDECNAEVLEFGGVIDIISKLDIPFKLLLLGRREADMDKNLRDFPQVELGTDGTTQDDIQKFINVTVDKLLLDFPAFKGLEEKLMKGFLESAGSMFLVVKLKEEAIRDQYPFTPRAVKKIVDTLNDISGGLEKLYEDLLLKKREKWVRDLERVAVRSLSWLLYARRPVTQYLLNIVVANDASTEVLHVDDLDPNIKDTTKHVLGVLVDWKQSEDGSTFHATLVHHSFREYLTSKGLPFMTTYRVSHEALLKACSVVLRSPSVTESLQKYYLSADKRQQGRRDMEMQRIRCQVEQAEQWETWEKRQKTDLQQERDWRAKEATRIQDELYELGDEAPSEFILYQERRLKSLQEPKDDEFQSLLGVLYLPERELMIYALEFLPYHLAEVLRITDWTLKTETTASITIATDLEDLVKNIDPYACILLGQLDMGELLVSSGSNASVASINLSVALQSLADTKDVIERLIRSDTAVSNKDHTQSHFYRLASHYARFSSALSNFCVHPISTVSLNNIWNDAVAQLFDASNPPPSFMNVFIVVTQAITDLRNVEVALRHFEESPTIVIGASILVHTLRRTAHMLSLWMIIHGHRVLPKKNEIVEVLLEDSILYPKLLRPPEMPPCIEPLDAGILLFDYGLWNLYPIILSFGLVLSFIAGVLHPLPVPIILILMLLLYGDRQSSFQKHIPMTIIHIFLPIYFAGCSLVRFYETVMVIAVGFCLRITGLVRFRRLKIRGALRLRANIVDPQLRSVAAKATWRLRLESIRCFRSQLPSADRLDTALDEDTTTGLPRPHHTPTFCG